MRFTPTQGCSKNNYIQRRQCFDATVISNRPICREHYVLRLRILGDFPETGPGQFVQLGCRTPNGSLDLGVDQEHDWPQGDALPPIKGLELCGPVAFLRRPFSLAARGDDGQGTWIEVIHRVVGVGTRWLAGLRVGDAVDLIGPLGNRFEPPPDKSLALLVGGGVGVPPMFYLAELLAGAGWDAVAFVGATSADLLAVTWDTQIGSDPQGNPTSCVREFARWGYPTAITTDDGTVGLRGRITDALRQYLQRQPPHEARRTVVFTCGPNPMMQAVTVLADEFDLPGQACLEQAMACGMGTCQSCVAKIESPLDPQALTPDGRPWRYQLTCAAGPVFPLASVVWR